LKGWDIEPETGLWELQVLSQVHYQLLCIENTKEQLPDMNFCAILYKKTSPDLGCCCPADPLLTDSFLLATPLEGLKYRDRSVMS
jgi:hypothetical protein